MNMSQEPFWWKFTGTVPYANPATPVLREPVQSKMHMDMSQEAFARKFTGKCRTLIPQQAFCATCAVEMHMDMSQEAFCAEIYRENTGR